MHKASNDTLVKLITMKENTAISDFNLHGKLASWNFWIGFGQSLPFTVIVLDLLYCSTSCYKIGMKDKFTAVLRTDCVTATRAGGCTFPGSVA